MRYSYQREIIYNAIAGTKVHPTAEYIYDHLKREHPKLSLGTVYRNLQYLSEKGDILKISVPNGPDRYDGDISHHYHAICSVCGGISDVSLDYFADIDKLVEDYTGYKVVSHEIMFKVICDKCKK